MTYLVVSSHLPDHFLLVRADRPGGGTLVAEGSLAAIERARDIASADEPTSLGEDRRVPAGIDPDATWMGPAPP